MLWWWATPFTLKCGGSFQCKLASHIKCLIKHIWFIILITILIITISLYKLVCQQQDKPAVNYTKNFTHYFESCFILLLTHPFMPSDGNSLTLPDIRIVQASFLIWTFLCPFYAISLHKFYLLFHLCSSFFLPFILPKSLFQFEWSDFSSLFSRAQIQSPWAQVQYLKILGSWQSNSAQRLLSLRKTALHLLLNTISKKNIPEKT